MMAEARAVFAMGVSDDTIDEMVNNKAHEGADFREWVTTIA